MSNFIIDCLDCDDIVLRDGYKELYKQDQHVCLQFNWLKFDKYGIPPKNKYHTTEESRMIFDVPILKDSKTYFKLKELDTMLKKILPTGIYTNILKEPENHPPLIKLKIKKDSKFWKDYKKQEAIEWNNVDDLRKLVKFNSEIRFVVKPKWWEYLGKVGVSFNIKHFETRESKSEDDTDVVIIDDTDVVIIDD